MTRSRFMLAWALLALAMLVVYAPALGGQFLWDDDGHITRPGLRSLAGLWRIWTEPGVTQQYYPLLHTAFWVQARLWGENPVGYHVVNVLLHALNAALVFAILRRLAVRGALLAACVFAFHPVHVESVAWITELKNTLSGSFYLGALLTYLRTDDQPERRRHLGAPGGALATTFFVAALLTKTVTATLPTAILVILWYRRGRLSWRRDGLPLLPWLILGLGAGLMTVWFEKHHIGAMGEDFDRSLAQRCIIAGRAVWFYFGKLIWPANLVFIYPRWEIDPDDWRPWLWPAAVMAALIVLWLLRRRIGRGPLAAALFFVGTLLPALGFLDAYPFLFSFVADHFQYLASLGIIALGSATMIGVLTRAHAPQGVRTAFAAILVLALAVLSLRQSVTYRDNVELYSRTIARNPTCFMAYNNLGIELGRRGHMDDALRMFDRAIGLRPRYVEAHINLGLLRSNRGEPEAALAAFQQAVDIWPHFDRAHVHLAGELVRQGRPAEALQACQTALRLNPRGVEALYNMSAALGHLGRIDDALAACDQALAIEPEYAPAHYNKGVLLAGAGQLPDAIRQYHAALAIDPGYLEAAINLAAAWVQMGRLDQAIVTYRRVLEIRPNQPDAVRSLEVVTGRALEAIAAGDAQAAALAQAGDPAQAIAVAQQAADLASLIDRPDLAAPIRARIDSYRRR